MNLRETLLRIPVSASLIHWRRAIMKRTKFRRDFANFTNQPDERFRTKWADRKPILDEATPFTGFDAHYIFHTAWAARQVARLNPPKHVDIASSLYFCSLISAFVPVAFYDYRPAKLGLSSLESGFADLSSLPFPDRSIQSISCMHVVEHVGLGRYGDPIDATGDRRAMKELERVLAPGGSLLFVVPVGKPRVVFNAHRIYSHSQITDGFPELRLADFALVPDFPRVELVENASADLADLQTYGCGCFHFVRPI
jgi:SAM-dependent methyltransferase